MAAKGAKRKRDEFGQSVARDEISRQLTQQKSSLRWLAGRIGMRGHGSLSRFLAAKQHLPFETILEICRELGIEGFALQRVIDAFALPALPRPKQRAARRALATADKRDNSRVRDARFFLNERVPYVYDTLRLLRSATTAEIANALHTGWGFTVSEIGVCLEGLQRLRLVACQGERWEAADAERDFVIPSKYSNEVGKRSVRFALERQRKFLDEPIDTRMVRSILTSLKVRQGSWREALAPKLLAWQDELLAMQGEQDDIVLNVVLGVVEVAKK